MRTKTRPTIEQKLAPYDTRRAQCPECGRLEDYQTSFVRKVKGDRSSPLVCDNCADRDS